MHEHQLSQFRPGESQRSRNVPDVLFVDEDGNPIEAGEENLIFVDEQGMEMTEEKAIKLIESGKFIDSRVLYDDELGPVVNRSNSMSFGGSTNSFSSNQLMAKSASLTQAKKSNSLTHAQIQAVQAAQIAQQQALINAAPATQGTVSTSKLMTEQAKVFAEAHVKAREQAVELAHIEADAYSNYSGNNKNEKLDSSDLQKTRSDRRLPVRPGKKTESFTEETYELDRIIKEQEKKMKKSNSYHNNSVEISSLQQNKSSSFHVKQKLQEENILAQQEAQETQRAERAARREEKEREYLKNELLKKQQELMDQHLLEKRQQELIAQQQHQNQIDKEMRSEARRLKRQKKEEKRERERHEKEQKRSDKEQILIKERQEKTKIEQRENRKRDEKRHRDYERQMEEQQRSQKEEEYRKYMAEAQENLRKVPVYNDAGPMTMSGISKTSSVTKISQKSSQSSFIPKQSSYKQAPSHQSAYNTSTVSPPKMSNSTRRSLESYGADYEVGAVRQVGYLSGHNILTDLNNVDMEQFEHFYEQNGQLEFEPHNLDTNYSTQFIDPFSAELFKDEIVDIDFGAIDAFTEALNQQILAEKAGMEPPKNLQFPSHVLQSNHASFLENQMFLGDSSPQVDEHSGINVQFIASNLKKLNNQTSSQKSYQPNKDTEQSMLERVAREQYSRNQSFGSMVDIQKLGGGLTNTSQKIGASNVYDSFIQNHLSKQQNLSRN